MRLCDLTQEQYTQTRVRADKIISERGWMWDALHTQVVNPNGLEDRHQAMSFALAELEPEFENGRQLALLEDVPAAAIPLAPLTTQVRQVTLCPHCEGEITVTIGLAVE